MLKYMSVWEYVYGMWWGMKGKSLKGMWVMIGVNMCVFLVFVSRIFDLMCWF